MRPFRERYTGVSSVRPFLSANSAEVIVKLSMDIASLMLKSNGSSLPSKIGIRAALLPYKRFRDLNLAQRLKRQIKLLLFQFYTLTTHTLP